MTNAIQELQKQGQSVWYDNIRRGLITSGELERLIEQGVTGLTANPTIFEKAISGSTDYDEALLELARTPMSAMDTYEALAIDDIGNVADLLRPVYDRTRGADGYASLEVSPALAFDSDGTVAEAERLFATLGRPNVMIKVPATPEGMPAIRRLIGEGINVNVTLIFSLEAYEQVREAYVNGLEDLSRSGGDLSKVASVASFFVSRVDTMVDTQLGERAGPDGRLSDLQGKAAVANAKVAYQAFRGTFGSERFASLSTNGARVQRPLWASTGTKNPAYSDVLYIESLVGPDTVNTMPPATMTAFLEHGRAAPTLEDGLQEASDHLEALSDAGISMDGVTSKLLADGVKSFADSFDRLLANVEEKTERLRARGLGFAISGNAEAARRVDEALDEIDRDETVSRIWRRDHTVWKPAPAEIIDRLGWLSIADAMREQVPDLQAFAEEIRKAGTRHVVLLGMGGSSLGPEVLRQVFGSAAGFPELLVLDSTIPARVQQVTSQIDPARTLFLVSSKSGGTVEPLALYKHFRSIVGSAVGEDDAGRHFVAVTDPGTPLGRMAGDDGFRRTFLNAPDIGGRYSVLSYFGLVPAALMGIDIAALLDRAVRMKEACRDRAPAGENPGAWLGAAMGALAREGKDKLTLVTSPSLAAFGLWVEQLIAESTGKEGGGIVPVAGEPLGPPNHYGDDRFFVYMRLDGDDHAPVDASVQELEFSGHPVLRLDLRDRADLGSQFFLWEFATAVAGALLGINPFDQPDVEQAKVLARRSLEQSRSSGGPQDAEPAMTVRELIGRAKPGSYLAIMPYLMQTPELDQSLTRLRAQMMKRHRTATTVGYGPRFLHSTGQLHKGGPDSGLFLQITEDRDGDVAIPGESYSFGVLADSQAQGDLEALQGNGRPVARLQVKAADASRITGLIDEMS